MQKDDATWLRTAYSVWACLTAFVFWKLFMFVGLKAGWVERFEAGFNVGSLILSIVMGLLVTWLIAKKQDRHEYLLASVGELRKVHWPDWENTKFFKSDASHCCRAANAAAPTPSPTQVLPRIKAMMPYPLIANSYQAADTAI